MENDAIDSPRGTDSSTANSPTSSTAQNETIQRPTSFGVAELVTESDIQDHNFQRADARQKLSAEELQKLARIRKDRANRFMVSVTDVDFLLEILERLQS